jgi:hypothetical protein
MHKICDIQLVENGPLVAEQNNIQKIKTMTNDPWGQYPT